MDVVDKDMNVEWAEMLAMEESIMVARSNNWMCLKLESDCASLVNCFNKRNSDLTMLGSHLQEIEKQFHYCSFSNFCWAPCCCNKVSNSLCNWAKPFDCTKDFNIDYPAEVHELVLNDANN